MGNFRIIQDKINNNIQLTNEETELLNRMDMVEKSKNRVFMHFKGNKYVIHNIAKHTETEEKLVIYKALNGDDTLYARPLDMFADRVDKEKYPTEELEYRFTEIEDNNPLTN